MVSRTRLHENNPSYNLPPHLMTGVQCQQIRLKSFNTKAVEAGSQVMIQRTAGIGFPLLIESSIVSSPRVVAAVQRVVGIALLYTAQCVL